MNIILDLPTDIFFCQREFISQFILIPIYLCQWWWTCGICAAAGCLYLKTLKGLPSVICVNYLLDENSFSFGLVLDMLIPF